MRQIFLFVSWCQRLVNITFLQRNHDAYYKVLGMLIERQYPEWVLVRAMAGWLAVLTGRWGGGGWGLLVSYQIRI